MARTLYIDIGASTIKMMTASESSIKDLVVFPNKHKKLITVMSNSEKIQLTDELKQQIRENGIRETNTVASLPESLIFAKTMVFPRMSTPELSTAIKWELDQSVPFPPNDIESSWSVFEKNSFVGEDKIGAYVVAVPSKVSELYLQLFELVGLEVVRLENEVAPLVKAFVNYLEEINPTLIIDIGYSGAKISLANKYMIFNSYYFPVGGQAITSLIADNFGLTLDQAEQYKTTYGMLEEQLDGKIFKVVKPIADNMIMEIRKMIVSFRNEYGEAKPSRLIMTGGGSYLQGLVGYFSQNLEGITVIVPNPLENMGLSPQQESVGPLFTLPFGMSS